MASAVNEARVPELIAEYESTHDVANYIVADVAIWPYLRIWLGLQLTIKRVHEAAGSERITDKRSRVQRWADRHAETMRSVWCDLKNPYVAGRDHTDVVLLSSSSRRERVAGKYEHTIADPWVDALTDEGVDVQVWEAGQIKSPRAKPSSTIQLRLDRACRRGHYRRDERIPCPPWFSEYSAWVQKLLDQEVTWNDQEPSIRYILSMRDCFADWFRRADCKLLVIECWYNWEGFAALLAASRLGIPCVDIQHGIQSESHYAYYGWETYPPGGYDMMPDTFWFWGDADVSRFSASNKIRATLKPGGNLWLNQWRDTTHPSRKKAVKEARLLAGDTPRCLLVTSTPYDDAAMLCQAIKASPPTWKWFVRLHRSFLERSDQLVEQLRGTGHPRLDIEQATSRPLYALMQVVDVHITAESTCALEALAFGVPTILFSERGRDIYSRFLDRGLMHHLEDPERIVDAVDACARIPRDECVDASADLFVSPEQSNQALRELLAHADLLHG